MKTLEIIGRYPNQTVKIDGVVQDNIISISYEARSEGPAILDIKRAVLSKETSIMIEHDAKELEEA